VTQLICGVDVSSEALDAVVRPSGEAGRFANDAEGIAALAGVCRVQGVELVAMEATGGYEKLAFALPRAQGVPVATLNPRSVRRFTEGMGLLEKTDRIDAGVIAWFAETKRIVP
jgi:transposase